MKGTRGIRLKWWSMTTNRTEICYTYLRPGVMNFLEKATELFEVVMFTASMSQYAKEILKVLDQRRYGYYLLTRTDCTLSNGRYIKDLSIINRDLKDVIIVDNLPESYLNHPYNGLPIESWYGNPFDKDLNKVMVALERLATVDDVRPYISKFVINDKISMYTLLKIIGEPRRVSPLDGILDSFKEFKKEAAAFFGFNGNESTNEDSKEENDENTDSNTDRPQSGKLKLPTSSGNYRKSTLPDTDPFDEYTQQVRFVY